MPKFDSLSLVGFKSFADKVEVRFDDKLTGIVGPNGCGKSNLFDALGWVLGAQNAREMRGLKMEDFIFSGTSKRKQSGMAQATLRLKFDQERTIEVQGREFTDDRLEICRKLYRSGESIYLVNDRRCRLRDVRESLEALGLGYASYAFIAQGKMESFLTSKPLERRAVIEEAAQISEYKSQRRRAELKLELARQNLLRATDIIQEVEKGLRSLKRQATKAKRYTSMKEEFRELQAVRFALEAEGLAAQLEKCSIELASTKKKGSSLDKSYREISKEYKTRTRERDSLEEQLTHLTERRSAIILESDRTRNAITYHQEKIGANKKYLLDSQSERISIQVALKKSGDELERYESELEQLTLQQDQVTGLMVRHTGLLKDCLSKVKEIEERAEDYRNQILERSARSASLEHLLEQLEVQGGQLRREQSELGEEHGRAEIDLSEREKRDTLFQKDSEEISAQYEDALAELSRLTDQRKKLEGEVYELESEQTGLNHQVIAFKERLQSLQEVELNHSNYSDGVQQFLNNLENGHQITTGGTLAESINAPPEFERLMEGFLDDQLEYVLVDSMDQAKLGLGQARSLGGGRCSFLTLQSDNGFGKDLPNHTVPPSGTPGVLGTVADLLEMDPVVESAFQRVLPGSANAVVVSDLDCAFKLAHSHPQTTFITMDGVSLEPRGLLTTNATESHKLGILSLKRQGQEVEERLGVAQKKLSELENYLKASRENLTDVKKDVRETSARANVLDREVLGLGMRREQLASDLARDKRLVAELARNLDGASQSAQKVRQRTKTTEQDLAQAKTEKVKAEKILQESLGELTRVRSELERVQQRFNSVASDRKVIEERGQSLQDTLDRIQEQAKSLRAREKAATQAIERSENNNASLDIEKKSLSARLNELETEELQVGETLSDQRGHYQRWKSESPGLQEKLEGLLKEREERQSICSEIQIGVARLETQLEGIEEKCQEQLGQDLASLTGAIDLAQVDSEDVVSKHSDLQRKLESFGAINMTALEEYQESEERHKFLTTQRSDLEGSIADTERVIDDLNRRSLEKFQEAFDAINLHFKKVFQTLFGGGDCGMQLLDGDDILESGLEVFAQPPGKRLQNVMLLSGGEKTLTVLALMVGLFTYRPSKFCVLDEVDAPLDDANISRFTNLLQEMCEKTQVIVVTHNKQTMEVADSLLGVTMPLAGVSEAISVRI
jgi:chromosome segregation protein